MAWLDGQPALNKRNIRWRYNEKFQISDAYLTTYVGGSDPRTFAPKQDQFIWCAPITVPFRSSAPAAVSLI